MLLMSVDPGLTTGVLLYEPITQLRINVVEWKEIRGEEAFTAYAAKARTRGVRFTNCERFIPFNDGTHRTWEPEALYIIGALRYMFGIDRVDLSQGPADAHRWGTETKLEPYVKDPDGPQVGKGGEGHAIMALKHGLLYTSKGLWQRYAY